MRARNTPPHARASAPRVHRIDAVLDRDVDDAVDVQVRADGALASADDEALVRLVSVRREAVLLHSYTQPRKYSGQIGAAQQQREHPGHLLTHNRSSIAPPHAETRRPWVVRCIERVQWLSCLVRIDGDSRQLQLGASAKDARRDLAAVGGEDLLERLRSARIVTDHQQGGRAAPRAAQGRDHGALGLDFQKSRRGRPLHDDAEEGVKQVSEADVDVFVEDIWFDVTL